MAEVAEVAGVGVGTVSRVLNDSPNVRATTRRRVLEVMERLNYRPNIAAARLSRGTPSIVVIVVPFLTRPSVVARLAGAIGVLDEEGYDTIVCNVETAEQRDHHLGTLAGRHRADGVVVVSLRLSEQHLDAMRRANIPMTMVDTDAPGIPSTVVDDILGGHMATSHLLGLGHRRLGFVGNHRDKSLGMISLHRRLLGYRRALADAGVAFDPALVRLGAHSAGSAAGLTAELLSAEHPPTAIFAASDTEALGVLAAAERSGRSVPGDLSVIGYDDIEAAAQVGLSTIRQPLHESGAEGARRLCAVFRGERVRPLREELPLEVVDRLTSARHQARCRPPLGDSRARPGGSGTGLGRRAGRAVRAG